jgi:hypothetical protein
LYYRQAKIIALLFRGYAACYFCRADLSVASPLLIEELERHGLSHSVAIVRIGAMTFLGVLAGRPRSLRARRGTTCRGGCYLTRDSVYCAAALLRPKRARAECS